MAYGLLAGVTPSSGLYMAFFPTLVYFVFGTSRHISVGTLSVISLMTLKLVQTYATQTDGMPKISNSTDTLHTTLTPFEGDVFTPMQVVTAAAFMCGVHQVSLLLCSIDGKTILFGVHRWRLRACAELAFAELAGSRAHAERSSEPRII